MNLLRLAIPYRRVDGRIALGYTAHITRAIPMTHGFIPRHYSHLSLDLRVSRGSGSMKSEEWKGWDKSTGAYRQGVQKK